MYYNCSMQSNTCMYMHIYIYIYICTHIYFFDINIHGDFNKARYCMIIKIRNQNNGIFLIVYHAYLRLLIFLLGILILTCDSSRWAFCMMYSHIS